VNILSQEAIHGTTIFVTGRKLEATYGLHGGSSKQGMRSFDRSRMDYVTR
jgi:hypothetical protein